MTLTVMPRQWWGAAPPKYNNPVSAPASTVFITHARDKTCFTPNSCSSVLRALQKRQMEYGATDIAYNFLIGSNGQVFEGRGWNMAPNLQFKYKRFNRNSLCIAFIGKFKYELPSARMFQAAQYLIELGIRKNYIKSKFLEFRTRLWYIPMTDTGNEIITKVLES